MLATIAIKFDSHPLTAFPIAEALPAWLPDEALFSLASRYHQLAGHVAPKHTARVLFGSALSGYQHDFPTGLEHFTDVTLGVYGSADKLIAERTILPFYLALRDADTGADAIATLRSPRLGGLKYRLGLTAGGFRANHPLKACRKCVQFDTEAFGTSYWHLEHQIPGVVVCLLHGELLTFLAVKSSGKHRFGYTLPPLTLPNPTNRDEVSMEKLEQLTRLSVGLWSFGSKSSLDLEWLVRCCRAELAIRDLVTENGRIRQQRAGHSYYEHLKDMRDVGEYRFIPQDLATCCREIYRLLGTRRRHQHPLRYVCLVSWLFKNWSSVTDKRESIVTRTPVERRSQQDRFITLLSDGNLSASAAARKIGIDHATAFGWARAAGYQVSRRPKHIDEDIFNDIVSNLRRGEEKASIVEKHGVSRVSVSRVIRSIPGLAEKWRSARMSRQRKEARKTWLAAVRTHGHLGKKVLRAMHGATYAWLYKNDSTWFSESRSSIESVSREHSPRVDWAQRDQALADLISRAAAKLLRESPNKQITFGDLCCEVEDLKPRLSQIKQLPLARDALQRAVKRRTSKDHNDTFPFAG